MSVEAGWYYAEGDPPGTVRRWNGEAWVGFPIEEPGAKAAAAATPTFAPTPGQAGLKAIAVIAQLGLLLLLLTTILQGYSFFQLAGTTEGLEIADDQATLFAVSALLQLGATVIAGIAFVIWFSLAYRNISLWARTRRSQIWTVLAWIVPFVNVVRPMSMMLELTEKSPRPDRQGELSPTPVVLWWFLWILPGLAGALITFNIARNDLESVVKGLFVVQGAVTLLNAVSVMIAIYLVQTITDSQERRRG